MELGQVQLAPIVNVGESPASGLSRRYVYAGRRAYQILARSFLSSPL